MKKFKMELIIVGLLTGVVCGIIDNIKHNKEEKQMKELQENEEREFRIELISRYSKELEELKTWFNGRLISDHDKLVLNDYIDYLSKEIERLKSKNK